MSRSESPHAIPVHDADAHSLSVPPARTSPPQTALPTGQDIWGVKTEHEKPCPGCGSSGKRNLVICIDGTSNQFSTKNTNVVELYSRLIKDEHQLTFYNSGIGTYAKPAWKSWSYRKQVFANKLDLAFALRLEKIIISAYAWLVDNYLPGDRIFLFGFSRGAYQVRALAAMIDIVGLLHKGNNDQIPFAYELYASSSNEGRQGRKLRKSAPSGLWNLNDNKPPSLVERLLHATRSLVSGMSPRRTKDLPAFPKPNQTFKPMVEPSRSGPMAMHNQFKSTFSRSVRVHFVGAWDTVSSVGLIRDKTLPATTDGMRSVCFFRHALALHEYRVMFLPEYANGGRGPDPETARAGSAEPHTKEVWFTGSHSDIGGGSTANTTLDKFGPALRWMSWEATLAGLRLDNSPPRWERIGVSTSMTAAWRLIECLPIKHLSYKERISTPSPRTRTSLGKQHTTRRPHFCANRQIKQGQRIHQSVYDECGAFRQPELVEQEPDAYIEATDILRPQEEVLRSGRILDKQSTRRLELLVSSVHGIQSLGQLDISQYIYNIARSSRNSEGCARVLRDLRSLHVAYVTGAFKVFKGIDLAHPADVTETSSETFAFHMCGHTHGVSSVTFLSSTRVVSGSWDETVRIWDASTGEMTLNNPLRGHKSNINCVAVCPARGLVASTSANQIIRLWTSGSDETVQAGRILHNESGGNVYAVEFSPDGAHLVSGLETGAICVWSTTTGEQIGEPVHGHAGTVRSLAFSADGKQIVSGSEDQTVRLWEWSPATANLQACGGPLADHTDKVSSVAFSPDARVIASGSWDRSIRLWDAAAGSARFTLLGHTKDVNSVTFSPSGRHVASGSDDWTVRIWDARTGLAVRVLRGHADWVWSVAFSPDGARIASGSHDKTLRVWDFRAEPDDDSAREPPKQDESV